MTGLLHIYTGEGKGKTSAATGLAVRFAGSGGRVLYTQFLKRNDSCELGSLQQMNGIDLLLAEKCFGFTFRMSETVKKEAAQYYTHYLRSVTERIGETKGTEDAYGMLVLDELATAYAAQVISQTAVLEFLKNRPKELEIVITGRGAAPELLEFADYVSEIKKIKHPYDRGVAARRGIEL